jgi:hypothetical protein
MLINAMAKVLPWHLFCSLLLASFAGNQSVTDFITEPDPLDTR